MLPCNVIVQENQGQVEVSAVDPMASMQAVENEDLAELAAQVKAKLERVIASVTIQPISFARQSDLTCSESFFEPGYHFP